jgi:hypothetical protein
MTNSTTPAAGPSSEEPAAVLCSKCHLNPRARKNSSWCKQCHNDHAALYRLRARPRERFEERTCAWKDCDQTFTWRSTHVKQECCSKSHYQQKRYWDAKPLKEKLPENAKRCSKCRIVKLQAEFSPSQYAVGNGGQCSDCWRVYTTHWTKENKERRSAVSRKSRSVRLLRKYQAYTDDFDQIVADQGGVCRACGGLPGVKGLHIDHDHATGLFRGLLCHLCNLALGSFDDDVDRMARAIAYVVSFRDVLASST